MGTHIEIGFSNNIYDNPGDVLGSVTAIADSFRAIEIELEEKARPAVFDATPDEYERLISSLRGLAEARSLRYSVHAPWAARQTDLTAVNEDDRHDSIDLLARTIQFASDIGAKVVTCHPGYNHHQNQQQLVDRLVDSLSRVRERAPGVDLHLCVETMGAQRPAQTLLELESQMDVCRRAGTWVCADIPHVASVFPEFPQLFNALRLLAPYVRQVHLADMVPPSHRHLPIGKGSLPLEQILEQLETLGYVGEAIVEEFNKGWSPDDYLSAAVAFRDRVRERWLASTSGV